MGHPCLVPFVMLKGVDMMSEVKTPADGEVYSAIIALRIVP